MIITNIKKQNELHIIDCKNKLTSTELNFIAKQQNINKFETVIFENLKVVNQKQIFSGYNYILKYNQLEFIKFKNEDLKTIVFN